jgi:NAD(P)-dependent dehydrogenase (short-subunit alcohol dehydrogenase family)
MARAALVTGGSSGIGLGIARLLREEGFDVSVAGRTREKVEAAAAELGAVGITADLSEQEECHRVVAEHRERHGRLDVLVNSAGMGIGGAIDELPPKRVALQLDVNLRAVLLVTGSALPLLRETGGLIVSLASIAGTIPSPSLPVYGAAKAAVIQFTRTINRAEQEHGVRATAISPGFVDTPMTDFAPVPKEHMIRVEDCAEVVRLLLRLSPHARIPHVVLERVGS